MRIRFSIRDLIFTSAIIGTAVGWWLDHTKLTTDFHTALDRGTRLAKERDEMEWMLRQTIGQTSLEYYKEKLKKGSK